MGLPQARGTRPQTAPVGRADRRRRDRRRRRRGPDRPVHAPRRPQLGVAAITLYTYVPGKAELIDVTLDTIAAEGPAAWTPCPAHRRARLTPGRAPRSSRPAPPAICRSRHSRPPMTNGITRTISALRALSRHRPPRPRYAGPDRRRRRLHPRCRRRRRRRRPGRAAHRHQEEQWYTAHAPLLQKLIDPARFPTISRFYYSGVTTNRSTSSSSACSACWTASRVTSASADDDRIYSPRNRSSVSGLIRHPPTLPHSLIFIELIAERFGVSFAIQ